ncbi:MAG: BLUF domain-containing protein [Erythrobacter sp.]
MPYRYVYVSTAPNLSDEEVGSILSSSVVNNEKADVCGLLLYNGRNFLQLLEGEKPRLNAIMRRINQDIRHTGIVMLASGEIVDRTCSGWAMKRVPIDRELEQRREAIAGELPEDLPPEVRDMIVNFAALN